MTETVAVTSPADEVQGAQSLLKGIDVLLAIGAAPGPVRFRDIERAVALPRASLHRLLAALASRQLIRFDARTRTYQVGNRVLELSRRQLDQNLLIRAAKPEMARLARSLGRTICLMVLDGTEIFVLDFEEADHAAGRLVRLWPRLKAVDSAAGRAILSVLDADSRDEILALAGASDTRTAADVSVASALGYAVVPREVTTGCASAAAAIVDEAGHPSGAIVCLFESDAIAAEDLHDVGRTVAEAARRASGHMGMRHTMPPIRPRPATTAAVEILPTGRDYVGENPVWHEGRQRLYWVDVLAPALRWWDPGERLAGRVPLQQLTAGLAFDGAGRAIVAGEGGVFSLDVDTGIARPLLNPEADRRGNRFNTAGIDSRGRYWAATMALNHAVRAGSLYSIEPDLRVTRRIDTVGMPKNIAFDASGRHAFFSDAKDNAIFHFAVDPDTGTLSDRRLVVAAGPDDGQFTGIAVDGEGCVWVACVGAWKISRYAPDGTHRGDVVVPVPMPTSCAFGGADLCTLYITSSFIRVPAGWAAEAPGSGQLLATRVDVPGQPSRRFGVATPTPQT